MDLILKILILFLCYLLGSFPTGFLFGKYLKNIDLRKMGSGSTGATNVLRNVGKWPAFFVFIIDVGKGFIAVKISQYYGNQDFGAPETLNIINIKVLELQKHQT